MSVPDGSIPASQRSVKGDKLQGFRETSAEPENADSRRASDVEVDAGPSSADKMKAAAKKFAIIVAVVSVVALVFAAFLPRWYSTQLGRLTDKSFTAGTASGITIGFVCTLIPLWLLATAWKRRSSTSGLILSVLGLLIALPNLITLWIVVGSGSGARIGGETMDIESPGYRVGTLIGFLAAVALGGYVTYLRRSRDKARADRSQDGPSGDIDLNESPNSPNSTPQSN